MSGRSGYGNSREFDHYYSRGRRGTQREVGGGRGHKHERALTGVARRKGGARHSAGRLRAAAFAGGGGPRPAAADAVDGWRDADGGLGSGPREIDLERQSSAWSARSR